jgi:hypothetical protein
LLGFFSGESRRDSDGEEIGMQKVSYLGILAATGLMTGSLGLSVAHADTALNFTSVPLASSDTPGKWYPDRYPPSGFQASTFGSNPVLLETISSSDYTPALNAGGGAHFYEWQGRDYDVNLTNKVQTLTIQMYVDPTWATNDTSVNAGMWASDYTAGSYNGGNPIIDYINNDYPDAGGGLPDDPNPGYGTPGFYMFGSSGWQFLTAGTSGWNTLSIQLVVGSGDTYYVNGAALGFTPDTTTDELYNVILDANNFDDSYSVMYQDFSATSAVPLPASAWSGLALLGGLGLYGAVKRHRKQMA